MYFYVENTYGLIYVRAKLKWQLVCTVGKNNLQIHTWFWLKVLFQKIIVFLNDSQDDLMYLVVVKIFIGKYVEISVSMLENIKS